MILRALATRWQASYPADHDFWYAPAGQVSEAGVWVSPETAMTIGAFHRGVRLIAETVASLSLHFRRRRAEGEGSDPADDAPEAAVLREAPNGWQTPQQFLEQLTGHAVKRGNGYARKVIGASGRVDALLPWQPDRVRVEQREDLRLRYHYADPYTHQESAFAQEEVFHLRGFGDDGIRGYNVIELARRSLGHAIALESYGARLFSQGARPAGLLKFKTTLGKEVRDRNKTEWQQAYGGLAGAHGTAALEGDVDYQALGMTNEDAQFLETRKVSVREIARWLGVPPHMLGEDQEPTHASAEVFEIGFVRYTVRLWVRRWEQAITRELLLDPALFPKFAIESLLRGDLKSRFESYRIGTGGAAWLTPNEPRLLEDMNPIDDPEMDKVHQPLNTGTGQRQADGPMERDTPAGPSRATAVLRAAAMLAARREIDAIRREATPRHLADGEGWRAWVDAFYARHAAYLAEVLALPLPVARGYATDHRAALLAHGPDVLAEWETDAAEALLRLGGD